MVVAEAGLNAELFSEEGQRSRYQPTDIKAALPATPAPSCSGSEREMER